MYNFCVFAGTTEGRELIGLMCSQPVRVTACVATEYGGALLPPSDDLTVLAGPMPREEIEAMLRRERFDLVIDATHPYAVRITESVAAACDAAGTEYLRLLREDGGRPEGAVFVPNARRAAEYLDGTRGNILFTTGTRELAAFAGMADLAGRAYARVLPMEDSLRACRQAGLPPSHILAMQGPFSAELNAAMLRAVDAAYLVTKDGGAAGGFGEKAEAARRTGAVLVVIGRPPQRAGLGYAELVRLLCRRYGFRFRPRVDIVGLGPGSREAMTAQARESIESADCVIGAARMLAAAGVGQAKHEAAAPGDIAAFIRAHPEYRRFAVVMSGDTGFFSGAKRLAPLLDDCDVTVLPGLSSLSYLCARLGTSYEDVTAVSVHGRARNIVPDVRRRGRVFVLTGGENSARALCARLTEAGLGAARVHVGERLSYPDERVTTGPARELALRDFDPLSAVLIENGGARDIVVPGLPDAAFLRADGVPMTKSETRAVLLSKLALTRDAVCWDVGAGTGSVAAEMGLLASDGRVYAIERREDAVALIRENCARLGAANVTAVHGAAPEACRDLPAPTHAFIGGASGRAAEIISLLLEKNPHVRIAASAVTLETVGELTECVGRFGFSEHEAVALNTARARAAGPYHLMTAQNPVYIFVMQAGG